MIAPSHLRTSEASAKAELLKTALLIRRFEERLLSLFSEGKLFGTVHTCIGQEWTGVALAEALREDDSVFSNHRGHGHYLARTGDVEGLMAEIMGRATGICGGMGGSQHLHARGFYSNGIQGGMTPVSAGKALAAKLDGKESIVSIFIGDGTLGEGALYETLNIASKWNLPLLFILENNRYAQSTFQGQTLAGTPKGRALAFDIEYRQGDTWEWERLLETTRDTVDYVRTRQEPAFLEISTYRLKAHSKGDDNRDPEEVRQYLAKDSLQHILDNPSPEWKASLLEIDERIENAVRKAEAAPFAAAPAASRGSTETPAWAPMEFEKKRVGESLYETLVKLFRAKPEMFLLGEDLEGPYGGAFKVSRDLSQQFAGRVRNTPISEAAITGIGTGLALGGRRPLVEIMFGDFLTLTLDQLLQHACKFRRMFNEGVRVPLIVRTPMGGKRGYGPTHSQSLEKHFLGIPDLDVLALNIRVAPGLVYERLVESQENPALVIENKVLYTRFLDVEAPPGFHVLFSDETFPTVRIAPSGKRPTVTVFCYGGLLEDVQKAVYRAFDEDEIVCEIVCPTRIHPLNPAPALQSLKASGKLLTVEEGPSFAALGSELAAKVAEAGLALAGFRRLGYDSIIPSSGPLELQLLPNPDSILAAIRELAVG